MQRLLKAVGIAYIAVLAAGCTDSNESDIDIEALVKSVETKSTISKQSAIDEITPALEFGLKQLESVCEEIPSERECQNELTKHRKQVNQFSRGEWEDIPKMSLEELAFLSEKFNKDAWKLWK